MSGHLTQAWGGGVALVAQDPDAAEGGGDSLAKSLGKAHCSSLWVMGRFSSICYFQQMLK
jgi:hypothetical protein